jgi:hypothetical protein
MRLVGDGDGLGGRIVALVHGVRAGRGVAVFSPLAVRVEASWVEPECFDEQGAANVASRRRRRGTIAAVARLHDVVFDSHHPASIARFWAAALDGYQVAAYDEAELARLRGKGILDPEDDPGVLVEGLDGQPRLCFQLVPEQKMVKNRVHLDLRCDAAGAELNRLLELGASLVADYGDHLLLRDPEGNEFCLFGRS